MFLRTSFPVGIGFDISGVVVKTGAKCTRLKVCLSACQFARVSLALFRLARSFPVFFVEDLPPFMMCARARQVSMVSTFLAWW